MPTTIAADAQSLISGYESYLQKDELTALGEQAAPALSPTPSILSFIGASSVACGTAASVITGSAISTIAKGC